MGLLYICMYSIKGIWSDRTASLDHIYAVDATTIYVICMCYWCYTYIVAVNMCKCWYIALFENNLMGSTCNNTLLSVFYSHLSISLSWVAPIAIVFKYLGRFTCGNQCPAHLPTL